MIKRDIYLQKIIDRMNNGMIKVITGIRRCGKSYLLFEIFYKYLLEHGVTNSHIIALQLDDRLNIKYRNPDELCDFIHSKIIDFQKYYILLDEVQLVQNFEEVLISFLHIQNVDIYVTGSNAKFLSSDIITEFRGRGEQIYLSPLSFREFFSASQFEYEDAYNEYSMFGGMPYLLFCKNDEQKISYLNNLFKETYIKDIVNRYNLRNIDVLEDVLNIISSSIGSLTNPNKLSNSFKSIKNQIVAPNTINQYLEYCVDSFLIRKAYRYDVKGKKYIDTPLKYYFTDIGLRNARLGFRQQEESHIMENIIYNELIIRGYNVDVGVITISEKNENNNYVRKQIEVDFVCNLGYERYYIQSALNIDSIKKRVQEERPLIKIDDSFRKIIIVKNNIKKWKDDNGVLFLGLKEFLLNPDSIKA
ncbi:MAG: ATP-binding protein [Firmicutes bacterium]|uniref:ATP-binding protein n=1 Tax=Candidatus Onthovivens merdipullorum TaxID=2840889 RepID=A0A9D9DL67_9BACL|nr:ATP-binding protein [Candidatus Onthovivens merdipullorum]